MPRPGHIERGIAKGYLKQADEETRPEWERMWLDLAMTRLLAAEGDEQFNTETMTLYYEVKERHARLSRELGYKGYEEKPPAEPGTLRYILDQRQAAAQGGA